MKAARVLDLYEGYWEGKPLGPGDVVLCADEKTCIQALRRKFVIPPTGNHGTLVDSLYTREGTVCYLAALDVFRGTVTGRVVERNGIVPFDSFVDEVMTGERCRSADRVFWIVDNGAAHQPKTFQSRLSARYPNAIAIHLPVHASWLNQVEAYFSISSARPLRQTTSAALPPSRIASKDFRFCSTRRPGPSSGALPRQSWRST